MEERTADEIAAIFSAAGDSVTVINTAKTSDETDDEYKDKIKRNVEHLEIIKAYKKVDEKTAYISIIIGLVGGFLMFPFPDFSKSLLVGVFFSKELFYPFIAQSLLFLSFLIATFLPAIILKIKNN